MKFFTPSLCKFTILFCASFLLVQCQEEEVRIDNPTPEEIIEINATLFDDLVRMAENEGSVDDIIDQTACASVSLPLTITINSIEITIDSLDDIALILQLYNESETDEDVLELVFPITLILPDYTTLVIENQGALDAFIATCMPVFTPCVDFVYPVRFSVFNLQFEFIETVTLTSDIELYFFLQNLNENEQIINLNYPVSLQYDNGIVVEVSTNEQLANAIAIAPQNCDNTNEDNDCLPDAVMKQLTQCFWAPTFYDGNPLYQFYHFTFFENNAFTMSTDNAFVIEGTWDVFEENGDTYISIDGLPPLLDPFKDSWKISTCIDGQFILDNGDDVQILFSQNCGVDIAQCFGSGLGICDTNNDGFVTVNFEEIANQTSCNELGKYDILFYLTYEDALNGSNPLPGVFETTIPTTQIFYYAVIDQITNELLYVSSYQIDAEDCGGCDNPSILTEDLVIYMPFASEIKELITNQFIDAVGNFVTDRNGNPSCAIGFTEESDPLSIPVTEQNQLTNEDAFTVSLWFKMQNEEAGDFEALFSNTPGPFQEGFSISVFDLNTPLFTSSGNQGVWDDDWNQEVDVVWTNTDWHHLVVTVNESNEIKLYRDGVLRNEAVIPDLNIETNPPAISFLVNVGFVGHLDDLRVYKKALNETEINTLFNLEGDCFDCL